MTLNVFYLLLYPKIMQIEGRTTSLFDCYAEMQLILCKDNAKVRLSIILDKNNFLSKRGNMEVIGGNAMPNEGKVINLQGIRNQPQGYV